MTSKFAIEFRSVSKSFGKIRAVDRVDLTIIDGEFFSILGPSGSGKTTCLRLIGGFEIPESGQIFIDGQDVTQLPPNMRACNTVFQSYALFPNLTVGENVGYSLMLRKVPKPSRIKQIEEMLELVRLPDVQEKKPSQLSGGQKQRVALARALINHPKILLLDEPLGALDLKLRHAMQIELKRIQQQVGITFVYVTHDQGEALSMSDRLGVFHNGRFEHVGTPQEIYDYPKTSFVAGFVGSSSCIDKDTAKLLTGTAKAFIIRSEHIDILKASEKSTNAKQVTIRGKILAKNYTGMHTSYQVTLLKDSSAKQCILEATVASHAKWQPGDTVTLLWNKSAMRFLADSV